MAKKSTALTVGLEEELFLVEKNTGNLASNWPSEFSQLCCQKYPDQIIHEFLACQVELITKPHAQISELENEYLQLRNHLSFAAAQYDMAILAASTHPYAHWTEQIRSESTRYSKLEQDLQLPAKRMLVGGMHFHVGVEDKDTRLLLMQYLIQFLPVFLSLTTSSPFWQGVYSGLTSSRMNVINALPRSGIPPIFSGYSEYQNYLDSLIENGAIESAKEVWWDIRLNAKYPTVEVRIADTCTNSNHAVAVCALFQCLAHHFLNNKKPLSIQSNSFLNQENRWRAQRYLFHELDYLTGIKADSSKMRDLIMQLIDELTDDATKLNCIDSLLKLKDIISHGTSSDKQLDVYNQQISQGKSHEQALQAVVDWIIKQSDYTHVKTKQHKLEVAN